MFRGDMVSSVSFWLRYWIPLLNFEPTALHLRIVHNVLLSSKPQLQINYNVHLGAVWGNFPSKRLGRFVEWRSFDINAPLFGAYRSRYRDQKDFYPASIVE